MTETAETTETGATARASARRDDVPESTGVLARRALILGVLLIVALPASLTAGANRFEAALVVALIAAAGWLATVLVSRDAA